MFHLSYEELESISDIGPTTAGSVVYYFEEHEDMVQRLLQEVHPSFPVVQMQTDISVHSGLEGKSFCVTGSFDGVSRDEIHKFIEENDIY